MCLATITIGRHNTFVCLFQMYTKQRRQDCCLTWMLASWLAVLWPPYKIRLKRPLNSYCNCASCVDVSPMSMFSRCRHEKSETCRSIIPILIVYSDRRRRNKMKEEKTHQHSDTHLRRRAVIMYRHLLFFLVGLTKMFLHNFCILCSNHSLTQNAETYYFHDRFIWIPAI